MAGKFKALLLIAAVPLSTMQHAEAATDAERIAALEEQLKQQTAVMQQQQQMLKAMDAQLKELKASVSHSTVVAVPPTPLEQPDPQEPPQPLSRKVVRRR